jgi:hypothetical protein
MDECLLPEEFKPTPYSVIIGRGKESKYYAVGYHRLQVLVSKLLPQYVSAINRTSMPNKIASSVASKLREACPQDGGGSGAFIRLGKDGHWYEVSDAVAREKTGYTFRDMLLVPNRTLQFALKVAC